MSSILAEPMTFFHSGKIAPNRFVKSAMSEHLCTWDDSDPSSSGRPTAEYLRLYEEWGAGQIGTIIFGNVPCDIRYPEGKTNAIVDPGSSWDVVEAFKPAIQAAKKYGSLAIIQLTHGGRQTPEDIATIPVSSSDIQAPSFGGMSFGKPRPLTIPEIKDVVDRFAAAAKLLHDAGADGIQLHAAHGYLLSQFLSPAVNKRTDEYGGKSLDNRSRIIFEIINEIKKRVNDKKFLISIKINSADYVDGGFDHDDAHEMVLRLEAVGVDLIELSGGTAESISSVWGKSDRTKAREAFFFDFASRVRPHLTTSKLCITGGFRTLEGMTSAVTSRATDLVGLGRPLTAEPHLCAALLSGASTEAKSNNLPTMLSTMGSGIQIREIASGGGIQTDLSRDDAAKVVMQKSQWAAKPKST